MSLMDHRFCCEYDIMLYLWGEGIVEDKNLSATSGEVLKEFRKEYRREPADVSVFIDDCFGHGLDYGFTGIAPGFLLNFPALKELIMPPSVENVEVTPELERLLVNNNVLIRGWFDTFAERLAGEYKLNFRPADFTFADSFDERFHESVSLKMIFSRNGSTVIGEDRSSPGSSAGNTFGGVFYKRLPKKFYRNMTAEDIANMYEEYLYKPITENERLAEFFEKAASHNIFMGNNK